MPITAKKYFMDSITSKTTDSEKITCINGTFAIVKTKCPPS